MEFTVVDASEVKAIPRESEWDAPFKAALTLPLNKALRLACPDGEDLERFRARIHSSFGKRIKLEAVHNRVKFKTVMAKEENGNCVYVFKFLK